MDFEFIDTNKLGGTWSEEIVVVRENVVYLRIVGDEPNYRLMTATVGDDNRGYRICPDTDRLLKEAVQLAKNYNCLEEEANDRNGRKYIRLFQLSQPRGMNDDMFRKEVGKIISDFFTIFDGLS